jgi:exodeoxyribonuclease-5
LRRKLHAAGTQTCGTQKKNREGVTSSDERPFCGTIHSLIYRPCDCREPKTVEVQKPCPEKDCVAELQWAGVDTARCAAGHTADFSTRAFEALKPKTKFVYAAKDEAGKCKLCGGKEWLRRETLDRNYRLIIVDEASMVDDMMLRDLRGYNVPILAVGDHAQLPPVGGSGSLMKNPNLRLEQIHRQAEGNPIIALSKIIRETGCIPDDMPNSEAVTFGKLRFIEQIIEERYGDASAERLLEMGLACYTNRRRVGLNVAVRRARGTARTGRELPRNGEHVICLRNMKAENGRPPVANGMRGVLQSDVEFKENVNYRGEKLGVSETQVAGSISFPEDDIVAHRYEMLAAQFGREKTFSSPEELAHETGLHSFSMAGALFDFGFAMTTHKLQGSSIADLVVCVERPGPVSASDWARWCYSSITRASEKILILK